MLVTLSGLDGAGKSTLAEALKSSLRRDGYDAVIFHMNKDVGLYAYLRNARDAAVRQLRGSAAQPPSQTRPATSVQPTKDPGRAKRAWLDIRRRIIWNKPLRKWVDVADLGLFLLYRLLVERLRGRIVIMDRYFYDRLADQADGRNWRYLRWFESITPTPDVAILVEVKPEEAFRRKGEYSVESMTQRRSNYRQIFEWVEGSIILPNDELDVASETLEQIVRAHLPAPGQSKAPVRG